MTTLKDRPRNILVAVDFSESSEKAVAAACTLALSTGATLHLLHAYAIPAEAVGPAPTVSQTYIGQFVSQTNAQLLALAAKLCQGAVLGPLLVLSGDPQHLILEKAKEIGAELIVLGTHGRRGLSRALLGSVAETVVRTAPCSVLVVR